MVTRKKLREIIAIALTHRRQHLHELAITLELDRKYLKGKTIRQLIAIEQMKNTYIFISFHMKTTLNLNSNISKCHETSQTGIIFQNQKATKWNTITDNH